MNILAVIDVLFSCSVVTPLVISFWRGLWEFMNYFSYLFPSPWILFISSALQLSFSLIQDNISDACLNNLCWHTFSRFYTYFAGTLVVIQWRSFWVILDESVGQNVQLLIILTVINLVILLVMKGLNNIITVPFFIGLDHEIKDIFKYTPMFKTESTSDLWMFVLDCGFSVCVIGTLVVFVWRGVWCLLDLFLYPGDQAASAWASLALGYSLVLASFAAQPLMKALVVRISGLARLCAVDLYLLFSFCGTINVWRGIWNLLNVYFIPEKPMVSFWMSHFLAFLFLMLINSSNSVLVRGVYIDAEEEGEQCVDFPCYYLRLFFQEKRKKKLLQQMQKKHVENLSRRKSEADGLIKENSEGEKRRQSLQLMMNANCQESV